MASWKPYRFLSFAVVLLVTLSATSQETLAAGMPAPTWAVGDWWKWNTYTTQFMWGSVNQQYFSNQTSWYNISGQSTIDFNGTSYDCFTVTNFMIGSTQTYSSSYLSYTNFTYNYKNYVAKNNLSSVGYSAWYNSTVDYYYTPGGHHTMLIWQHIEAVYLPPYDGMDYPIDVNETWNVSATIHTWGITTSQYDNATPTVTPFETWAPSTTQMHCDATQSVTVPAGTFDCMRMNYSYVSGTSVTTTYSYYSYDAGNTVKYLSSTYGTTGSSTWVQNSTQELIDYSYFPLPVPETVLPSLAIIIAASWSVGTYLKCAPMQRRKKP